MHHTKIWGGHGPLAPPFPTPMNYALQCHIMFKGFGIKYITIVNTFLSVHE